MKHKPSKTSKWNNGFKKINDLKVEHINNNILFTKLSDIYSHFEILFDMYNNDKLTDREKAVFNQVKKERVVHKVKQEYKQKLNKMMSAGERRKVVYLKYRAKLQLNRPPPKIVAKAMVKFSKVK